MSENTELTQEQIDAWVAKQLANAPERSSAWVEQMLAGYLDEPAPRPKIQHHELA
jgi:hypothetical protein